MKYTVLDIAKVFLERAQNDESARKDVTNMKLQKLVFFAQVVSLCVDTCEPLHENNTHAWDYGPVAPLLYKKIRQFGAKALSLSDPEVAAVFRDCTPVEDERAIRIIDAVWERYKNNTSVQLSMLSHRRNSPWSVVYNRKRYGVITHEDIQKYRFGEG